jgi:hypothetical protein
MTYRSFRLGFRHVRTKFTTDEMVFPRIESSEFKAAKSTPKREVFGALPLVEIKMVVGVLLLNEACVRGFDYLKLNDWSVLDSTLSAAINPACSGVLFRLKVRPYFKSDWKLARSEIFVFFPYTSCFARNELVPEQTKNTASDNIFSIFTEVQYKPPPTHTECFIDLGKLNLLKIYLPWSKSVKLTTCTMI